MVDPSSGLADQASLQHELHAASAGELEVKGKKREEEEKGEERWMLLHEIAAI